MSHDATAWAKTQKTGSSSAKFILLILADYAGTDYSCYPSVKKLAEIAELGESTVRQATKLLAELGLIRVFYRHKTSGLRRSCRYQLLVDGPETAEPDAEDWASYRPISADGMRQDLADDAPGSGGYVRQDLAHIPVKEPSLIDPPVLTPAAARPTATRVPDDFWPDESMRAWFDENHYGDTINGKTEHERFMDYWRAVPGVRGKKLDWPATWRNWMRNAAERAQGRPGVALAMVSGAARRYPSTTDAKVAQTLAMGAMFEEEDAR